MQHLEGESMDRQFYEFWGNFLINVAKGQKQMEEMTAWMRQGYDDKGDLASLFRCCYGVPPTNDTQHWQKAISDFNKAFIQFAAQFGWVAQSEHRKVLEKCDVLEKKVQEQEATIRRLRDLLAQKGLGHTELFDHFRDILKEQTAQFNAFMETIGSAVKEEPKK
jgi:uncharacterized coiled-coil protein SlyX